MLQYILSNNDFQTWLVVGWQHSRQPIRSFVRKSLLIIMGFSMGFGLVIQAPDE